MKKIRIGTYNVNGIRAAMKKGLVDWVKESKLDVICFQETKAQPEQIESALFEDLGYHCYWYSAVKKGYSGVGVISKIEADHVEEGIGIEKYDNEGRNLRIDLGDLSIMSSYFPSGTTGGVRQDFKYEYLDDIFKYLKKLRKKRKQLIVGGDYNIAHLDIDIHNPKKQHKSSGFLPEERAWMTKLFESGFIDVFRNFNMDPDQYSWWSFRSGARDRNKGWRIDYLSATENLKDKLISSQIIPSAKHSDHCPVMMEIQV